MPEGVTYAICSKTRLAKPQLAPQKLLVFGETQTGSSAFLSVLRALDGWREKD